MTKDAMVKFVVDTSNWITKDILKTINDGRIPSNWEGEELRLYITEKFIQGCDAMRYASNATVLEYEHDVVTREL